VCWRKVSRLHDKRNSHEISQAQIKRQRPFNSSDELVDLGRLQERPILVAVDKEVSHIEKIGQKKVANRCVGANRRDH